MRTIFALLLSLIIGIGPGLDSWWNLPPDAQPETNYQTIEEPPTVVPDACVIIPIRYNNGTPYVGYLDRVYAGGLTYEDVRASMVGRFLNIAINQPYQPSADMELRSIDVTGLDTVTICLP